MTRLWADSADPNLRLSPKEPRETELDRRSLLHRSRSETEAEVSGTCSRNQRIRLVLLRTAAVLLTAVPITIAAGLLLPLDGAAAVAWVLPSLAFTLAVLGVGAWVDPWAAAVAVGAGWVGAVAVSARLGDVLAVVAPTALVGYVVLIVAGALILALGTPAWRLDGQWTPMQPGRERT